MAREYLAQALPKTRMQLEHAADMRIGILVIGIESGKEWMEPLALLLIQLFQRRSDQHVGSAIPIDRRIVTRVVTWALGLVLVPFLRDGDATDHHMIDTTSVHRIEQLLHAVGFLEKIHVMQMRIAIAVIASFSCSKLRQHQEHG